MRAIILLGAPGAGKGTIAEGVKAQTPFQHLSTGDMLRESIRQGAELGKRAEEYIRRGELVPDDLIIGMVFDDLDKGAPARAVMFDGFPRTMEQARMLDEGFRKRGAELQAVFLLEVSRELVVQRLTGRRICRACGTNYHVVNIPPKREGICDRCGGELYQRQDDTEETIVNRLNVFNRQTEPLVEYYTKQGKLARIDASQPREQTVAQIVKRLG